MKTKISLGWMYILSMVVASFMAACGHSQKKTESVKEQKQTIQPKDTVTLIESETVIEVDSITTDTTAKK